MNTSVVLITIVGAVIGLQLLFNYITRFEKSSREKYAAHAQAATSKAKLHEIAEDSQKKQKKLMEDIQQKIKDNANKR